MKVFRNPKPQIIIFGGAYSFPVATNGINAAASEHHDWVAEGAIGPKRLLDIRVVGLISVQLDVRTRVVYLEAIGSDETNVLIPFEKLYLNLKPFGVRDITAIHASDIVATRQGESVIQRWGQSQVCLQNESDSGIGVGPENLYGAVCGAVIDNNEFKIRESLLENAVHGPRDVFLLIVGGHDDAYSGRGGGNVWSVHAASGNGKAAR